MTPETADVAVGLTDEAREEIKGFFSEQMAIVFTALVDRFTSEAREILKVPIEGVGLDPTLVAWNAGAAQAWLEAAELIVEVAE